jgi:valyl-tRNA synthetase
MGASVDWSREAFTLDAQREKAVRTAFKNMYEDGLIYQGHRIVNWDPKGQTTISDDEIIYKEEKTKFYYFKYGPFVIGTSRPETKFGDKYVVMHPDDTRYAQYSHGQQIDLEWINGPITATIIKDTSIDMEFGTGVMTITPWHSVADFEIAQRHNLDKEQIIDKYGKLLPIAGEFAGIKITEARDKIVEKLRSKGLVEKEEDYTHNIATAERTDGIVEPQIMKQWFIDVNKEFTIADSKIPNIASGSKVTLKQLMLAAIHKDGIEIIPERFEKTYFHWIENLRDWCISRQIWYGHQIPVWYKGDEIFVGIEAPTEEGWIQDEDTLDTWFSSGLWTFSTLGWPDRTEDFLNYHPTNLLETGYDIIFFWVARMVLMSTYILGDIPFKTVYLHGLVRDAKGKKMSKSIGNAVDPIDMIEKYGADAVRMSLLVGVGPGSDSNFSEDKVRAYKKFANKIWNATRFVLEQTTDEDIAQPEYISASDQTSLEEFHSLVSEITKEIEEYKLYLVSEKLYHYFWHTFADIIIEDCKKRIQNPISKEDASSAKYLLRYLLINQLKVLHPFMPFITEEIWQTIHKDNTMLLVGNWPTK